MSPQERSPPGKGSSEHREGFRILATAIGLVLVPIALLAIGQPISARGIAWIASLAAVVIGCAIASRRSLRIAAIGALAWLATIGATLAWPDRATFLRPIVLPEREPPSRLQTTFAERDASFTAFRAMRALGALREREMEGFAEPLAALYDEIESTDGAVTTMPFLTTLTGSQSRDRFDVLTHDDGDRWVLFLHGYGGSFASYCWVVARAAAEAGWSTACPAMSIDGRWDRGEGPAIANRTLAYLRLRGARTIVLAGLSNGAIGASRLAAELEREIAGLVLISGLDWRAAPIARPTLVWHGEHDTHFDVERIREYARGAPSAELVEVDGDHFALVENRAELTRALRDFLSRLR